MLLVKPSAHRDMLDRLQSGRMARGNQQQQNGRGQQMMQMLNQFGDLIGKQQRLMDDTHGARRGEQGQQGQQQGQQQGEGERQGSRPPCASRMATRRGVAVPAHHGESAILRRRVWMASW